MDLSTLRRALRSAALAGFALLLVFVGLASHAAAAEAYPNHPIRVIVPYPPGDVVDIIARLIGPKMAERMGQPFVVDNRPGASGQIGMALLKNAPGDGYTIGFGQGGNLVVAPHTKKNLPYDPLKDFRAVAIFATNYLAVVANLDTPFNTPAEMVSWAKANPDKLTVATNGEGGFPHLAFEHLAAMAHFKFQHVPYKGASQITTDLIGGQVMVGIGAYTSLSPQVLSGRLKLIGVTNHVPVADKPNLPIFADAVPGYDSRGWFGAVVPASTPNDIVEKLNAEINRAMKSPEVAEVLKTQGLILVTESPKYFDDVIKRDYERYGKLARSIGFEPR